MAPVFTLGGMSKRILTQGSIVKQKGALHKPGTPRTSKKEHTILIVLCLVLEIQLWLLVLHCFPFAALQEHSYSVCSTVDL